jgi:hypothetical protein
MEGVWLENGTLLSGISISGRLFTRDRSLVTVPQYFRYQIAQLGVF